MIPEGFARRSRGTTPVADQVGPRHRGLRGVDVLDASAWEADRLSPSRHDDLPVLVVKIHRHRNDGSTLELDAKRAGRIRPD